MKATTRRGKDRIEFAERVLRHIEEYTVPQYGDAPEDQVEEWTEEECILTVKRYAARHGRNAREGEQMRDFLKIAHYTQIAELKHTRSQK